MRLKLCALVCALTLACAPCSASAGPGVCEGEVVSAYSVAVYAPGSAQVTSVDALPGQLVEVGDALATLATERVYAHSDGTVASVECAPGDAVEGAVLSVAPTSRYQIVCTVEDAYELPENMLLHVGQTLYAKCTRDGSHRAVARVISIDGEYFTLEALGGELYTGETVYLYLSDEFESRQRVGIGTVVGSSVSEYSAAGTLTRICVEPGDTVERGQLLYEYVPDALPGTGSTLPSDASGILLSTSLQAGQTLVSGEAVAEIAPLDALRVSVYVSEDEAADIAAGDAVALMLPWQEDEDAFAGTVESIARVPAGTDATDAQGASDGYAGTTASGEGTGTSAAASAQAAQSADAAQAQAESDQALYEVRILPAQLDGLRIGMSVTVDFNPD